MKRRDNSKVFYKFKILAKDSFSEMCTQSDEFSQGLIRGLFVSCVIVDEIRW